MKSPPSLLGFAPARETRGRRKRRVRPSRSRAVESSRTPFVRGHRPVPDVHGRSIRLRRFGTFLAPSAAERITASRRLHLDQSRLCASSADATASVDRLLNHSGLSSSITTRPPSDPLPAVSSRIRSDPSSPTDEVTLGGWGLIGDARERSRECGLRGWALRTPVRSAVRSVDRWTPSLSLTPPRGFVVNPSVALSRLSLGR